MAETVLLNKSRTPPFPHQTENTSNFLPPFPPLSALPFPNPSICSAKADKRKKGIPFTLLPFFSFSPFRESIDRVNPRGEKGGRGTPPKPIGKSPPLLPAKKGERKGGDRSLWQQVGGGDLGRYHQFLWGKGGREGRRKRGKSPLFSILYPPFSFPLVRKEASELRRRLYCPSF